MATLRLKCYGGACIANKIIENPKKVLLGCEANDCAMYPF